MMNGWSDLGMMDNERREWIFEEEFIRFWFGVE